MFYYNQIINRVLVVHENVRNCTKVNWPDVLLDNLHELKEISKHFMAVLRVGKWELVVDFLFDIAWQDAWYVGESQHSAICLVNGSQANIWVQTRHSISGCAQPLPPFSVSLLWRGGDSKQPLITLLEGRNREGRRLRNKTDFCKGFSMAGPLVKSTTVNSFSWQQKSTPSVG